MDGKLCPGIQPPLKFLPPSFRESSPFNPEIFQAPSFLKFWPESQIPSLERGGGVPTMNDNIHDVISTTSFLPP